MAVDPISNTVAITKANPAYAPAQIGSPSIAPGIWGKALAEGTLPDDLICPVLHELTHHSSLNTPVGNSLSALTVSHTSIIGETMADAERLTGPARDMIRVAAANSFLRPLLEGLALFAEFDAVSGDVPIANWSSQVVARLFCFPEMRNALLAGKDLLSPLKTKLEILRLTPTMISRKKALLRRDLFDPDGYLLGYLLIKTIWVDLTMRHDIWRNTDMFLMFANDYFFNDFGLAYLLVQPNEMSIEDELKNLDAYLHNRVVELGRNSAEFGKQFIQYHLTQNLSRPNYQGYSDSLNEHLHFVWTRRTLRSLHWQTPNFISTRGIPRVLAASALVNIDIAGKFEAHFHDGFPPLRGPALKAGRPANGEAVEGDGSVEAVVLLPQNGRRDMRVLLCVFLDKDLVATFDPETGDFNDADDVKACDRMASYLAIESFAVMVENETWLPEGSKAAEILSSYSNESATRRMLDLWSPFALISDVGVEERFGVIAALERGGLKAALSLDESSLGKISRMSLCPLGSDPDDSDASEITTDRTWLDDLNIKSDEILGFRLLATKNGKLAPSRV
ncbi:MAG: hypothetical protein ABL919_14370 [Methylococcales bacterium]